MYGWNKTLHMTISQMLPVNLQKMSNTETDHLTISWKVQATAHLSGAELYLTKIHMPKSTKYCLSVDPNGQVTRRLWQEAGGFMCAGFGKHLQLSSVLHKTSTISAIKLSPQSNLSINLSGSTLHFIANPTLHFDMFELHVFLSNESDV